MAEDLTEYLHENGIKVRYLHSDIDTLERIEIMRDLRMGVFDVLVGINLLREGLDIPECALVGILDADKEGFLRSETSLIQTISEGSNIGGNLKKHLKALNKKMKDSASNLEFEEAAKIRDEIRKLESTELEITLNPKIRQYDVKNKLYPKGRSTMGMPGTRAQKGKKKWKQIK